MSIEEFKGWLKGYLEDKESLSHEQIGRILEEVDQIEPVLSAPALPPVTDPFRLPLGPGFAPPFPWNPTPVPSAPAPVITQPGTTDGDPFPHRPVTIC